MRKRFYNIEHEKRNLTKNYSYLAKETDLPRGHSPPDRTVALIVDVDSGPYSIFPTLRLKQHTSFGTQHSTLGHSSSVSQLGYSCLATCQFSLSLHEGFLRGEPRKGTFSHSCARMWRANTLGKSSPWLPQLSLFLSVPTPIITWTYITTQFFPFHYRAQSISSMSN